MEAVVWKDLRIPWADGDPEPTASKNMDISVLQLQGTEFTNNIILEVDSFPEPLGEIFSPADTLILALQSPEAENPVKRPGQLIYRTVRW